MILVDTHLLLWSALRSPRLSARARTIIDDPDIEVFFSVASIWEATIKRMLGRKDFADDPRALRQGLLANNWRELDVTGVHALAVADLPPLHKDPFDRILLAQAKVEGMTLLTSDKLVAKYPGKVRKV
ncbi:MAG: type II toxin-antitoxin system VapC family toxin [Hyphomonadaceae bacterium]|nr:type II toxin-antitoxin system VapC family toxin [Hyphomonadaceae bacterium]